MSKYPVAYESERRGSMMIEEMNGGHLVNAYRKATKDGLPTDSQALMLASALEAEIRERNLNPRYKNGRAPGDELLNGAEAVALEAHAYVDALWEA
jgi:hypothetical protein